MKTIMFFFEPKGFTDNKVTFTNGVDIEITSWEEDKTEFFNHVKVIGGFENFSTLDTYSGSTGTAFALTEKPSGVVRAVVSGVEVSPGDYTVDAENKRVIFDTNKTDPTFTYAYDRPIIVENQDDASVNSFGEVFRELPAPWLDTFGDARTYSQNLIDIFGIPLIKAKGFEPNKLNFDVSPGELVSVVDNIRVKSENLIITKIKYKAEQNTTEYEFGTRDFIFFDWQREVQERIKKLERRFLNERDIVFTRLNKHNLKVTYALANTWEQNSPQNTFILDHVTLNRLKGNDPNNYEGDCSNNNNDGLWSGTGIGGNQYSTSGWRLSDGEFNGSDNVITVDDDSSLQLASDFTIAFAIKVASLPGTETYVLNKWDGTDGYAVRINASNKLELIYSDSGSDSTIAANTALTANTYQHVTFVKNGTDLEVFIDGVSDNTGTGDATVGTNANDLEIGKYSTSFLTGFLDEVRIYDNNKLDDEVKSISIKIEIDSDLVLWITMDDPKLDIRETARTTIT